MKRVIALTLVMGCIFLGETGLPKPGEITTEYDELEDLETSSMFPRILKGGESGTGYLSLGAFWTGEPNTLGEFALLISYRSDDWMFIDREKPLVLLIDGDRMELPLLTTPSSDVLSEGTVIENALYAIYPEQLKTIIVADSVKLRVYGKHSRDRVFGSKNFEDLQNFYKQLAAPYVEGSF